MDKKGGNIMHNERKEGTNGFAISGFVCSLVLFGLLGLIFSIIGLSQIEKNGQEGKGLAIAGIVVSIVRLFFILFYILVAIMAIYN